jgi:ArsR family metal-binding transcriptional regulator
LSRINPKRDAGHCCSLANIYYAP